MSSAIAAPCDALPTHAPSSGADHPTATLAACILGSSLAFIDGSVVNVALPALGRDLHAGPDGLAWAISAYLLTLSALILLGGALGDRYGRRRIFLIGVGLFLVASLGCAAAPSLGVLLAARAVQGTGAALLMPSSLAILGASFNGETRGKAIGTWAGVGALASAIGPVAGGWLIQEVGWRSIFLLNLPVGLAAAALAWRFVPESRDRRPGQRLDALGAGLVTVGLGLATWALTAAARPGKQGGLIALAAIGGLAALAGYVWREGRAGAAALMPLTLFRDRAFVGVSLMTFLLYAALGGLLVLLPFTLMQAKGYSPIAAGAAMLPVSIVIGLGSRIMGKIAARVGGRLPLGLGSLVVGVGLVLYGLLRAGPGGYVAQVLPGTAVVALGMAGCVAPLTTTVIGSVDADHVGAASGFNSAIARTGGLVATALMGFVFARSASPQALIAGAHAAALAGAALAVAAAACALVLIRTPKTPEAPHG